METSNAKKPLKLLKKLTPKWMLKRSRRKLYLDQHRHSSISSSDSSGGDISFPEVNDAVQSPSSQLRSHQLSRSSPRPGHESPVNPVFRPALPWNEKLPLPSAVLRGGASFPEETNTAQRPKSQSQSHQLSALASAQESPRKAVFGPVLLPGKPIYATDPYLNEKLPLPPAILGGGGRRRSSSWKHAMNLVSNRSTPTSWKTAFTHPDSHVGLTLGSPASFTTASIGTPKSKLVGGGGVGVGSRRRESASKVRNSIDATKRGSVCANGTSAGLSGLANDYHAVLLQKGLVLPQDKELNWSGKGQHVAFAAGEAVPVQVLAHLGASMTAIVEKVQCRRIILARKTMRCTRNYTVTDALREVEHLHRLRHFHIIQLVGSYIQGRNFAILMYPAADWHLGTFLEDTADMVSSESQTTEYTERKVFLASTLSCLISALAHIHAQTTKHMDIKPANILVRRTRASKLGFRVYIADFGLSRSFATNEHSQTDGPTAHTPKFCAPEVSDYDYRGRSADIFSLGCVYLEILTVYRGRHPHDFAVWRKGSDGLDESFHANLPRVREWVSREIRDKESPLEGLVDVVEMMVQRVPESRPTADAILRVLGSAYHVPKEFLRRSCCKRDPEAYVAHETVT